MSTKVQEAVAEAIVIDREQGRAAALAWASKHPYLHVPAADVLSRILDQHVDGPTKI